MSQENIWAPTGQTIIDGKMADVADYLRLANNGRGADPEAFMKSEYGQAYGRLIKLGFQFEEDPTGKAITEFYAKLGLNRQMYENDDYYKRWLLITPQELATQAALGKYYPVVFVNHGGSVPVPVDEFQCGWWQVAADERIIVVMLQNTNCENVQRVLDRLEELYPIDTERVYMTGESQGGYEVTSALFRMPARITAVVTCGNDIWRDWDNFNVPFTDTEKKNLKDTFVPFMQVVGQYEASSFAPVNDWYARKEWGRHADASHTYVDPRRDDQRDPTHIVGGKRPFSDLPEPPVGVDKHAWMIERLNTRMASLGCAPRDVATCISYLDNPEIDLHKAIGFYGDEEQTMEFYGYKHWRLDIHNRIGLDAFRYVVVENSGHHWPVMAAKLGWDFMKQFRRDTATSKIVADTYQLTR
ncbi:alpha/beta hydrolase family protein [Lactiplantibacillus fabifermentans]|uniref:Uncharacterized protein n=2 Tax=Lactiplantibacillus fabifermentans TaxID=483011 RepID=A0A0R2NFV2_9LACO|nr:alpha/beta hydrolase [Lactiplantibacillus fabifermentans]ETY75484.1 hypothetical protein LFAB_01680 [Lactiplantibacillus fabifermentans T30PCM01]KRO24694.1 hypothetical protein DY78_GL001619 [Lactiplantibacillus fabifermentans DSM 21115]